MFRILLVDDEAQERDGIRFLIEKYRLPLSVVEAQNGQKALEYLKGHPVDILFTDVKMPYKDGLELAKETFQFNPDIRISELAEQTGYPADGQYFAKVFKKNTGMVPSEYRKMLIDG